ncbi:MAG: hypothetical protein AB1649_33410 [Chloroflexota bacterium]
MSLIQVLLSLWQEQLARLKMRLAAWSLRKDYRNNLEFNALDADEILESYFLT